MAEEPGVVRPVPGADVEPGTDRLIGPSRSMASVSLDAGSVFAGADGKDVTVACAATAESDVALGSAFDRPHPTNVITTINAAVLMSNLWCTNSTAISL